MTTYNNTVFVTNSTSPGNQYTRNVVAGDTITVTTNSLGGTVNAVPSNCSVNGSTGTTSGIANGGTCSVTNFTSSSYSILFTSTANGTNFTFATLSGTVTLPVAPVVNNSQSFASTVSATTTCDIALTSSGSNGTLQYNKSTSTTVPTSGWQSSSTVSVTRGTAYYFWARRGVGYEDRTDSALSVPYLAPDTSSIAGTNDNILWAATTGSTTVSGVLANHTYIIKKNNGSYRRSDTFTANGAVTISDQEVANPPGLPPQSSSASTYFYEFVVYRNVNVGGQAGVINANGTLSGGWTDTNRTFSITREKDPIAPVITVTGGNVDVIVGDSYTDQGATATDNFAPANPTVVVVNPVDTSVIGVYTVTYNATDTAGNAAAQKTRTVNVVPGILGAFNTNQTGVELSSTNYAYAQYTGSTSNVLAARTDGTGTFVVTASATQPNASLFDTAQKNIANGEYLHVKQIASGSYSTAVSSTYRVGGPGGDTSVHTVTTRDRDYTMVPFVWGSSAPGINPGQVVESPIKFITGADVGSQNAFSVSGNGAQYRLNSGGSFGAWTSTPGIIEQGVHTNVQIRGTASSAFFPTQTEITSTLANQSGTAGTQVFYIRNRSAIVDPDDFTFPNSAAQEPSATNVASASRAISGIEAEISVSVSGGEWRKYTTAWGGWTTSAGTVVNGNSVQVRGTASGSFSGTNVVTLNVGPDSPTFTIVTRDADVDPDDFTFPNSAPQEPSATNVASASRTISGIEANIAVSVSGTGAQWTTGGAWTSSPGTAQNGQGILVRGTASASFDGTSVITLNVGTDTVTFTIVTRSIQDTPSNLAWLPVVGSQGSTVTSSSTITLANMTDSGTLSFSSNSIASLEMNIDSGGWVAAASVSVSNGTTVALRGTAPSYGTNTSVVTTIGQASSTFTIKSYPESPTNCVVLTDPGTESATAGFTLRVSGTGTGGGTTYISLNPSFGAPTYSASVAVDTNGDGILTFSRAGDIVYVRNIGSNGLLADASFTIGTNYLAPDTSSIAGTNDTIEYLDTTATTTVSGVLSGHTYVVKKNNGDNDKPRSAIFTANGALTISDNGVTNPPGLPLVNNTFFYEFLVYRNTDAGGAGAPVDVDDWVETNRQFSVTRNPEPVTAPDGLNFTPATTAAPNVSVTVEGTGGAGGTIEVSEDSITWVANNSSFTNKTRGTEYTFYTRRVGSGSTSATYSDTFTPPYLNATLGITLSEGSSLTIGTSDTQFILTVSGGNANDQYQVRDSSGTEHESRIGNGGITVTDTPAGNSETYTIFGRRPEGAGGDDNYVTTGVSILVVQQNISGIVPPAILSVTDDNANAASVTATVNLSSTGSGGTLQYNQTTSNSVPASGWGTLNTFSHPRNTTRYYWASRSTNTAGTYDSLSKFVGTYTPAVYGIQIRNVPGALTLDITDRVSGVVSRGSVSVTTGTTDVSTYGTPQYVGTSASVGFIGMTPSNSDEFEVWIAGNVPTAQFGLTNFSINRGTGSYTVTYRSYTPNQTISIPYFNVRY